MLHVQRRRRSRPRPRRPWTSASSALDLRHTSASASTRRCPAGRRSRCPVSSLGAGALNGPIAASSTAACSGVTTSWYSVTSPDSTTAATAAPHRHQPLLQVVEAHRAAPYFASSAGRSRRSCAAPHCVPSSSSAARHRRHRRRVELRLQPGHLTQRRQRQTPATPAPSFTPAHTTPNGDSGSGSPAASGANDPPARAAPATSTASLATCPAPPCRNDGACSRTHACAFDPDSATTPRRTASTATWARAAPPSAVTASSSPISSASSPSRRLGQHLGEPRQRRSGSTHPGATLRQTQPPAVHTPSYSNTCSNDKPSTTPVRPQRNTIHPLAPAQA